MSVGTWAAVGTVGVLLLVFLFGEGIFSRFFGRPRLYIKVRVIKSKSGGDGIEMVVTNRGRSPSNETAIVAYANPERTPGKSLRPRIVSYESFHEGEHPDTDGFIRPFVANLKWQDQTVSSCLWRDEIALAWESPRGFLVVDARGERVRTFGRFHIDLEKEEVQRVSRRSIWRRPRMFATFMFKDWRTRRQRYIE